MSSDKGGWKEETFVIAVCVVLLVIWLWGVILLELDDVSAYGAKEFTR